MQAYMCFVGKIHTPYHIKQYIHKQIHEKTVGSSIHGNPY